MKLSSVVPGFPKTCRTPRSRSISKRTVLACILFPLAWETAAPPPKNLMAQARDSRGAWATPAHPEPVEGMLVPIWQRNIYAIWSAQFLAMIGLTLVAPFLPLYLRLLGVGSVEDVERWSGVVFAAPFAVQTLAAPLWGVAGDRYGRKLMVLRAMAGIGTTSMLSAFVRNVGQLVFLRAVQGGVSGFVAASNALVTASIPPDRMGAALGVLHGRPTAAPVRDRGAHDAPGAPRGDHGADEQRDHAGQRDRPARRWPPLRRRRDSLRVPCRGGGAGDLGARGSRARCSPAFAIVAMSPRRSWPDGKLTGVRGGSAARSCRGRVPARAARAPLPPAQVDRPPRSARGA